MSERNDSRKLTPLIGSTSLPLQRWLPRELWVLLAIFCLFYFFRLGEFSLSIDDELEALRDFARVWILTGRWAGFVIDQYLLPQSTIPFLPIFLFGFFMCLAYRVLLRALGIMRLEAVHYFAFPFFAALPTWTFLAAFAANIASAGFGYFLVACTVLQFRHCLERLSDRGLPRVLGSRFALLGGIALAVAVGIYQSFVFGFLALGLALLLRFTLLGPFSWALLFRQLLLLLGILVFAGIVYVAADNALRTIYQLHDRSYLANFMDWRALLQSPIEVTGKVVVNMAAVYGGHPALYGMTAFAFPLLMLCGLYAILATPTHSTSQRVAVIVLTGALLAVPFTQHFLAGGNMPARTLVAVPVVFWMFALTGLTAQRYWLGAATFCAAALAMFQMLYSATLLQAANHFARVHDQQFAAALHTRIVAAQPEFDKTHRFVVDFYGAKRFETSYPRPFSSTAGFSFFEWGDGTDSRILSYMRLIGYDDMLPASAEQRHRDAEQFAQMPAWPAQGAVRVVDGVTLIKLDASSSLPR